MTDKINLVPAGGGWCPVHGNASCPEDYMLMQSGRPAPGYTWDESLRCGRRVQTYRIEEVTCQTCGRPPEEHSDSDQGPMTVCPTVPERLQPVVDDVRLQPTPESGAS